jgi:hypothetical protein
VEQISQIPPRKVARRKKWMRRLRPKGNYPAILAEPLLHLSDSNLKSGGLLLILSGRDYFRHILNILEAVGVISNIELENMGKAIADHNSRYLYN